MSDSKKNPETIEIDGLDVIHRLADFASEHGLEHTSWTDIVLRLLEEHKYGAEGLGSTCDLFGIGSAARRFSTLKTNCENAIRRSHCLGRIENIVTETVVSDEPEDMGAEYEESLLNWGENPDQYEARFKSIWLGMKQEIDQLKAKIAQIESGALVLVPNAKVKFFSNDGENFEIHETLQEAKREAELGLEYFQERLADQQLDPDSDDNFHSVSYGVVLGKSGHSVDHVVTQQDVDEGNYSYEVGTQIMSLFLIEATQEQS